ncbi:hypothetical protein H4582DRAFT_2060004 [Lactarius indigo]|nr:hypothetical protein H4582DRAFT_2060004 [Lactarius indigo]
MQRCTDPVFPNCRYPITVPGHCGNSPASPDHIATTLTLLPTATVMAITTTQPQRRSDNNATMAMTTATTKRALKTAAATAITAMIDDEVRDDEAHETAAARMAGTAYPAIFCQAADRLTTRQCDKVEMEKGIGKEQQKGTKEGAMSWHRSFVKEPERDNTLSCCCGIKCGIKAEAEVILEKSIWKGDVEQECGGGDTRTNATMHGSNEVIQESAG